MRKILITAVIIFVMLYGCTDEKKPEAKNITVEKQKEMPVLSAPDSWASEAYEEIEAKTKNITKKINQSILLLVDFQNKRYVVYSNDTNTTHLFFNGAYYKITEVKTKCTVSKAPASFYDIKDDITLAFFMFLDAYKERDVVAYQSFLSNANQTEKGISLPPPKKTGELGGTFTMQGSHSFGENLTFIHSNTTNSTIIYRFRYTNTRTVGESVLTGIINEKIQYSSEKCTLPK